MGALIQIPRKQLIRFAARRIDSLIDFLEKEATASRISERVKPFSPQTPIDIEAVVRDVMSRLREDLPAATDWKKVEAEVRDALPAYDPLTHRRFRDITYFLLDLFFDHSGCTDFFIEKPSDIDNIRLIPADTSISRILAANHSSNIDDILVGQVADSLGLGLAHFAAGANLMSLPKVEQIMKELNVVKVKRSFDNEKEAALYKTILGKTCLSLTDAGEDFIIFPEANNRQGARSRNGTFRLPERLRVVEGIMSSTKDAFVIPIAISYSRVPEYYKLVHRRGSYRFLWNRRRPLQLHRESVSGKGITNLLAHSLLMSYRDIYGRACASVGEPFSINQFLSNHPDATEPARLIGEESMRRIAKVKKVLPSHIVAEAIEGNDGISISALTRQIEVEIDNVVSYHRDTFGSKPNFSYEFEMGPEVVLEVGLRDLRVMNIVKRRQMFSRPRAVVNDHLTLAYYGNMSDHRLYCPDYDDKVCVIGAGQWGYTLAYLISKKFLSDPNYRRHSIVMFDTREEITEALKYKGAHPQFFQGMAPPKIVYPKFSYKDAISESKAIVLVTP